MGTKNTVEMNSLVANLIVFVPKESFEIVLMVDLSVKVKATTAAIELMITSEYNMAADSHLKCTAPVRNRVHVRGRAIS
jgi:hypothetical protein